MAIKFMLESMDGYDSYLHIENLDGEFIRLYMTDDSGVKKIIVLKSELEAVLGIISQNKLPFWQKAALYTIYKVNAKKHKGGK